MIAIVAAGCRCPVCSKIYVQWWLNIPQQTEAGAQQSRDELSAGHIYLVT